MFFEGSLQDGIGKALQDQKLIACFVTDDIGESLRWEAWLKNDTQLYEKINSTAVLLRLQAGSEEAGYLAAFCPIDSAPTFIVIRNGVPTAHLKGRLEESEFKEALVDALDGGGSKDISTLQNISEARTATTATAIAPSSTNDAKPTSPIPSDSKPEQPVSTSNPSTNKEQVEKAKRAAQIKKEQSDALAERRRVLAQIESDKKERQARGRERKIQIHEERKQEIQETRSAENTARKQSKECALKVRTFDGATISSTFPSDQTLRSHVRPWIDETVTDLREPYEFKWLLAPMPNQRISASQEEETLVALGLTPNATLVMVPIKDFSTAYSETSSGIIGSTLSYGYGMISGGFGMASNLLNSVMGRTEPDPQEEGSQTTGALSPRVRTLADRNRNLDDQQLYNGNQLNFERRKDDNEDDK